MSGKNTKKKVLFLIHTLQIGGAEKVLVDLVNNIDKEKFDVTLMTVIDTGAFRSDLSKDIKYCSIFSNPFKRNKKENDENNKDLAKKSGNLLSGSNKIKLFLAKIYAWFWKKANCEKIYKKHIKEKYDVEVAFLEGISAKIISASNNKDSKKIAWIHVDLLKERKTEMFFKDLKTEKNTYEKFDKIIAVSKMVKESFIRKYSYKEDDKVIVKYNPINEKTIMEKAIETPNELVKQKITLCTVGRLSHQKGYDRLLRAMKKLKENDIDVDLWIIGVGAEEENLKKYINKNNLDNVKLLGYKSNPYSYIKMADIFVSSSRAEGFSTVISEAIILGKVVLATDCAGTKEMLGEDNEYGLVTKNSDEEFYEGLYNILTDKNLYERYKYKVKERKTMFDFRNSVVEIENLLEGKF